MDPYLHGFNVFADEAELHRRWLSPQRVFLLTYNQSRIDDLEHTSSATRIFAASGGKTILTNH